MFGTDRGLRRHREYISGMEKLIRKMEVMGRHQSDAAIPTERLPFGCPGNTSNTNSCTVGLMKICTKYDESCTSIIMLQMFTYKGLTDRNEEKPKGLAICRR
jgi:hypothetical protein